MTLATNALTTWSTVSSYASIASANQTNVERLIEVATALIEGFCNREFHKESRVLYLPPQDDPRLVLPAYPLASSSPITSIYLDGTLIASTEYEVEDASLGYVWRDAGWGNYDAVDTSFNPLGTSVAKSGQRVLKVTYTGGYVCPNDSTGTRDLPKDIEQACIDTTVSLWRRRGADVKASGYEDTNEVIGRGTYGYLPGAVMAVLKRYQRVY